MSLAPQKMSISHLIMMGKIFSSRFALCSSVLELVRAQHLLCHFMHIVDQRDDY